MIPKKIHYCWFGKTEKPENVLNCINSWKKIQQDFELIEWNEDNFDINSNQFLKEAYKNKKWAFVSDYARAFALYNHGGFYLDTDMEIRLPLTEFLKHRAVCGFEIRRVPFSAFWGVEKNHELAKDMKEYYEAVEYNETPNTQIFSKLLVDKYGADANKDAYQELKEGIVLYPSTYFSLDLPKNYITHHFSGSWHGVWDDDHNTYKNMVNTYGVLKQLVDIPDSKENINNVIRNHKLFTIEEVLDKIPTRFILSYLIKYLKRKVKIK